MWKTRHILAFVLGFVLTWMMCSCSVLSPSTELEVSNETGAVLEVLAAQCGSPVEPFATLPAGARHTEQVEPGCHRIEGWADDGRYGEVQVTVVDGSLHRVPFISLLR